MTFYFYFRKRLKFGPRSLIKKPPKTHERMEQARRAQNAKSSNLNTRQHRSNTDSAPKASSSKRKPGLSSCSALSQSRPSAPGPAAARSSASWNSRLPPAPR